jgi:hypothetical protein
VNLRLTFIRLRDVTYKKILLFMAMAFRTWNPNQCVSIRKINMLMLFREIIALTCRNDIGTCRPIAGKRVDKHVSVEIDSWKLTCYGTHFLG